MENVATAPTEVSSELAPALVIEPKGCWGETMGLKTLWQYRELLYFFALRDVKLRYKQTALGVFWTILQPLIATGVFTIFFGKLARLDSDGLPYPLFCFAAILPWNYFAGALARSTSSLAGNAGILSKVYFPRFLFVVSSLIPGLVDFCVGLGVLFSLMLFYGIVPTPAGVAAVAGLTGLNFLAGLAFGLWFGALNVRFRDVGNILPFVTQIWMFATPIIYSLSMIPEPYQWMVRFNPMVGIISGYRSALLGTPWDLTALVTSMVILVAVLVGGSYFFRWQEQQFADLV